jgi:hypothetical protein
MYPSFATGTVSTSQKLKACSLELLQSRSAARLLRKSHWYPWMYMEAQTTGCFAVAIKHWQRRRDAEFTAASPPTACGCAA